MLKTVLQLKRYLLQNGTKPLSKSKSKVIQTSSKITVFMGAPIEYESERTTLLYLIEQLTSKNVEAFIFSNINIKGRQIDFVLIVNSKVVVIEAKGYSCPIRGGVNGRWEVQVGGNRWKKERNFYDQVLNAKYMFRDALNEFTDEKVSHPDAALIFTLNIPNGSSIPSSDHKVKIGSLSLLSEYESFKSNIPWSMVKWQSFASIHGLEELQDPLSALDAKLFDAENLLTGYKHELEVSHTIIPARYIPQECKFNNHNQLTTEVSEQLLNGFGCLITGCAGLGKTTFAQYLAKNAIKYELIPVFIEAKHFKGEFVTLLNAEVALLGGKSFKHLMNAVLKLQKVFIIILDGFNECKPSERNRLLRCLRAMNLRYRCKIVMTSQDCPEIKNNYLNLPKLTLTNLSLESKVKIANLYSANTISSKTIDLLDAVKTGLEAKIVGELKLESFEAQSRFALFDQYIRRRLAGNEKEGIKALVRISDYLLEEFSFSLSVREAERLLASNEYSNEIVDLLLNSGLVVKSSEYISFVHELFLNTCTAESINRKSGGDARYILGALNRPINQARTELILGAIETHKLRQEVLLNLTDTDLVIAMIRGDAGAYYKGWVEQQFDAFLKKMGEEIESVAFMIAELNDRKVIVTDESTLFDWNPQEYALLNALQELIIQGSYLVDIYKLIGQLDHRLDCLLKELSANGGYLIPDISSQLFSAAYVGALTEQTALGKVCKNANFGFINNHGQDFGVLESFLNEQLNQNQHTDGQLYFILEMVPKTGLKSLYLTYLPTLIRERWSCAPYNLRLTFLYSCPGSWRIKENLRQELIEVLDWVNEDFQALHVFIQSELIDVYKRLGGLEDECSSHELSLRAEVTSILSNLDNPEYYLRAHNIYFSRFDHPYEAAYNEVWEALSDCEKLKILLMALKEESLKGDEIFLSSAILDLVMFRNANVSDVLHRWMKIPIKEGLLMPQFAVETFFSAYVVLGLLGLKIESQIDSYNCDSEKTLVAAGDLSYWVCRDDITECEIKQNSQNALNVLSQHNLGLSLDAVYQLQSQLSHYKLGLLIGERANNISLIKYFPKEMAAIARHSLINPDIQKGYYEMSQDNGRLVYAMQILGNVGNVTDMDILMNYTEDNELGKTAITELKNLRECNGL